MNSKTYTIAECAKVLADSSTSTEEGGASKGEMSFEDATEWMFSPSSVFMKRLKSRVEWACVYWHQISIRLPRAVNADGKIDRHLLEDLAYLIALEMLQGKIHGRNAFGFLVDAITKSDKTYWTDGECLVFLLGQTRRYPLPFRGESAGDCPAIWRYVVNKWRQRSNSEVFRQDVYSQTFLPDENVLGQRIMGYHQGQRPIYSKLENDTPFSEKVDLLLLDVQSWPMSHKILLLGLLRGERLLKALPLDRLLESKQINAIRDLAKCFNISKVQEKLRISSRQITQNTVEDFISRLSEISNPQLSSEEINLLMIELEALVTEQSVTVD